VQERTATLNESNRLLQEANTLLEGEIAHHKETAELLRSSEAYIKNILESMPLMLVGLNKDMQITQWNKRAEENTGIGSADAVGRNLWDAYPLITVSPDQVTQVFQEQKPIVIKQSQRGQFYYDITIYPLYDHIETGLVILVDDVTHRTMAENMLIQRDKLSAMGELASTMAHDIDIPLQAILQDVQRIQSLLPAPQNADSEQAKQVSSLRRLLTDAEENGRQASGTVANLLSFAHSHEDIKQQVDIPEVVDHSIDVAKDIISGPSGLKFRDVEIEKHYEDNLPTVPGYVSELQQVFLSLFRHACHALGKVDRADFKPMVRVEVSECYDALWIKVQHNGLGLTSDEQQDIFEPYFQNTSDASNVEAAKRLSFSYFIITDHHRGQMAVTSDVNVGTTFHIQLQLK
jgi:PAS domain S-box-containing protein